MGIIDDRMQLAGTVVSFVNDLDVKQKEVIAALTIEADRVDKQVIAVNQHLADMTILKDAIEKTHTTVSEITAGTASFADSTRAEFEATSLANKEAHEKVDTLFAKTELTFAESEKKSLAFREEIRVGSDDFAGRVQEMYRTGNRKFDAKPAVVVAKHDKKEVSV